MTESDLRLFAEDRGGYWNDVIGGEAVIERGNSRVFIGVSEDADESLPDDLEYAVKQLGKKPASMLSVRIGHARGSLDLAEDVAGEAVRKWGGYVDRNEPA